MAKALDGCRSMCRQPREKAYGERRVYGSLRTPEVEAVISAADGLQGKYVVRLSNDQDKL